MTHLLQVKFFGGKIFIRDVEDKTEKENLTLLWLTVFRAAGSLKFFEGRPRNGRKSQSIRDFLWLAELSFDNIIMRSARI